LPDFAFGGATKILGFRGTSCGGGNCGRKWLDWAGCGRANALGICGVDDAIGDATILRRWTPLPVCCHRNNSATVATIAAIDPMRIAYRVAIARAARFIVQR
jgi:hypothetical protein